MVPNVLMVIPPERLPAQTQLLPNYPNPFTPRPVISFELSQDATVTIVIYNVKGQPIRKIDLGYLSTGRYINLGQAVYWDGKSGSGEQASSGSYFYQLQAGDYTEMKKIVVLK